MCCLLPLPILPRPRAKSGASAWRLNRQFQEICVNPRPLLVTVEFREGGKVWRSKIYLQS
eukprot:625339-Rhodomonas_salina.1